MGWILDASNSDSSSPLGGKGKALLALDCAGLPVPVWFALSPEAAGHGMTGELRSELIERARRLGEKLAVRSSASDEDGTEHSFAGQLESFLFVSPEQVPEQVERVWASAQSERIVAYRREHGLDPTPRPPAVIVQKLIEPMAAGVAFSADAVSGRRGVAIVSAVRGIGETLVSGEADAETWEVERDGSVRRTAEAGGVLADEQARAVAGLARQAQALFGRPQDIEWAIDAEKLWILQSRPITTLQKLPDPDGQYQLWDNSNIAESYGGMTTPMTFSFARHAYEGVYIEFCRMMGVSEARIAANADLFPRMLGLIRGRVYYNLLNWYRLLSLLPGYTVNRGFMEQMMGVKEKLPEEISRQIAGNVGSTRRERWRDALRLARSILGLVRNHFTLPGQIGRFYRRLDAALAAPVALELLRADELASLYRSMERQLLSRWDAPLVNDFFAMIFYGLVRKTGEKWCGDAEGTLQNDLISGDGGMISAEPAARMKRLAELARARSGFADLLLRGGLREILEQVEGDPEFGREYRGYLEKFADRCLEELKLESATLQDDPLMLLRSIGQLASAPPAAVRPPSGLREAAEQRVQAALRGHPVRRRLFGWILRNARARVRDRENLRFERMRVFGRVRRIVLELGRRLHAAGALEEPRDVFYLELEEVMGWVEGTATAVDFRALSCARQAEFARYRRMEAPADRFATRGAVHEGNQFQSETPAAQLLGDVRKGLGCCPGRVHGKVRLIRDPRGASIIPGEILVAERTDPGWIMLFPSAAAVLVERGSLLSHSAIVSRELGIPSIVSITGLTQWLATGDEVEMDGSTGQVKRVARANP